MRTLAHALADVGLAPSPAPATPARRRPAPTPGPDIYVTATTTGTCRCGLAASRHVAGHRYPARDVCQRCLPDVTRAAVAAGRTVHYRLPDRGPVVGAPVLSAGTPVARHLRANNEPRLRTSPRRTR